MKKIQITIVLAAFSVGFMMSCGQSSSAKGGNADSLAAIENAPKLEFLEDSFDFGELKEGDVVEHKFAFRNVGKSPLLINDVQVQCGCTVASKPEKPIGVGQQDVITVKFNTENKVGINKKMVTVFSNGNPNQNSITFTAVVKGKNEAK
ncbi:MAG: DUF1573 domain-containing protein [Spirosomaceae bacterium]|jgi:hypothetical protein|nr:DUF1573 domain-containing protein [Spirosomataceae bacterium]